MGKRVSDTAAMGETPWFSDTVLYGYLESIIFSVTSTESIIEM